MEDNALTLNPKTIEQLFNYKHELVTEVSDTRGTNAGWIVSEQLL